MKNCRLAASEAWRDGDPWRQRLIQFYGLMENVLLQLLNRYVVSHVFPQATYLLARLQRWMASQPQQAATAAGM